jgi:hypothetical protein
MQVLQPDWLERPPLSGRRKLPNSTFSPAENGKLPLKTIAYRQPWFTAVDYRLTRGSPFR